LHICSFGDLPSQGAAIAGSKPASKIETTLPKATKMKLQIRTALPLNFSSPAAPSIKHEARHFRLVDKSAASSKKNRTLREKFAAAMR